ncbi:hypothetical protein VE25_07510 [Devosia geojensis]|uniref:Uncharacterized protein n=1 Tax=Devosia geojensis TaxID=443610 RepID=A0A0F5FUZ0_9HYPH|nr:hypothetical protein [Devosia geojensis]KKB12390.1 hypothetical protein VE25_07510 [Devosia geojensis]
MTPDRFNECLEHIHWSTETLAEILGCDESLAEAYSLGLTEVPMKLGVWLEVLAQTHEAAESGRPTGLKGKRYSVGN